MGVAAVADSREPKLKADVLAAEWLDKNVTILDEHTGGAPLSVQDYFILLEWQNPDAPFTREERVQILRPIATRYLAQEAAKVAAAEALRKRGNHEFRHGGQIVSTAAASVRSTSTSRARRSGRNKHRYTYRPTSTTAVPDSPAWRR